MATSEADVAAKLIERLLVDPAFRARFRRNPAEACREAGLEELAQEMQLGAGKAMMTLDMRESKSSLAGVMMAAAMEGVGIMQFAEHVAPHLDDIPEAIGDVLSRVNLPAVGGSLAPPPTPTAAAGARRRRRGRRRRRRRARRRGWQRRGACCRGARGRGRRARRGGRGARRRWGPRPRHAGGGRCGRRAGRSQDRRPRRRRRRSPRRSRRRPSSEAAADKAVADITEDAKDLPSATDLPGRARGAEAVRRHRRRRPAASRRSRPLPPGRPPPRHPLRRRRRLRAGGRCRPGRLRAGSPGRGRAPAGGTPPPEPSGRSSGAAADVADQAGQVKRRPIDPTEFGQDGHGGALSPEGAELLKNKNLEFDSVGIADIKAGKIDPRVIAVLTKLSEDHKIKISCMCSDHSKFTSGGSISNHAYGRGLDIASVDGEIVNPGSAAARELASELSTLPEKYRPDEIGSPWPISGPGYFTDAGHQDHVHVGFKTEIDKSWAPPADVAAGGRAGRGRRLGSRRAGRRRARSGRRRCCRRSGRAGRSRRRGRRPSHRRPGDSGQLHGRQGRGGERPRRKSGSGVFMVAQAPAGPASAVAPPASVPGMVDATAAAAAGTGGSSAGTAALKVAQTQLGVHEQGTNTGAEVDKYLASAKVAPGNPWCASFVTWSLEQAGIKMDGTGWAAVQTWVRNAEAGKNNLQIVSAAEARPGDIVAYDWGHQDDFGADGHIGFLASDVKGGRFTALEGNNQDQVMKVPRGVDMANVKFIRVNADVPGGAGAAAPTAPAGRRRPRPARRRRERAPTRSQSPRSAAAAPTRTPATTRRRSSSPPGSAARPRSAACPKELPVMASLVESGVKNLNFGDADSVGFFQMRGRHLEPGRVRRLPREAGAAGEVVPRHRRARQGAAARARPVGHRPEPVRRVDRRRRAPRRAVPRPLPAAPRRGPRPARQGRRRARRPGRARRRCGRRARSGRAGRRRRRAPPEPPKPGDSGTFMAAKAEAPSAAGGGEGRLRHVHGRAGARRAGERGGGARRCAGHGRRRRARPRPRRRAAAAALGAAALKVAQTQLGVHEQGTNTGAEVDKYLGRGEGRPRQPVVRELRDLGAREGGPQDGRHRLGRRADLGPQRRGGQERPQDRQRRRGAARRHRRLRLGPPGRLRRRRPHRLPRQRRQGRQVHRAGGQQPGPGHEGPARRRARPTSSSSASAATTPAPAGARRAGAAAGAAAPAWPTPPPAATDAAASGGYPGDNASKAAAREVDGRPGREARAPAAAAGHGVARRVGRQEPQLRRRRLRRLLPDARRDLEPGRLQGLPGEARAAGQVVPRHRRAGQEAAHRRAASRSPTRSSSATGSPTSSAPPRSTAAATSCASARPTGCSAAAGAAPRRPPPSSRPPPRPRRPRRPPTPRPPPRAVAAAPARRRSPRSRRRRSTPAPPYKWGGSTPQTGFDCSGLVQWAYAKAGIQIPRVTDAQFAASNGTPVERGDLQPGDLVFFGEPGNIYHVGDLDGRGQVPARAEDRRRRQGREPEGVLLLLQLRRREALRQQRAGRRRRGRPLRPPRRGRGRRPEGGRRGAGRGRARRRRGQPQRLRPVHGGQDDGGAPPRDRPVHAGGRPEGGAGRRRAAGRRRRGAGRRRRAADRPPPRRAAPPPSTADAAGRGAPPTPASRSQLPDDISDDYPGNDASKDEIAKWLAKQADKHGLPPELPVMASLVESGVKNLNYGDADSVGFFQMRVGIWNQGAYKGYPEHPELQAKWFIDQALAVKKKAIAVGRRRLRQGPLEVGRVDRRHRAPGRAVPRPLPAAAQGSARAAEGLTHERPGRSRAARS